MSRSRRDWRQWQLFRDAGRGEGTAEGDSPKQLSVRVIADQIFGNRSRRVLSDAPSEVNAGRQIIIREKAGNRRGDLIAIVIARSRRGANGNTEALAQALYPQDPAIVDANKHQLTLFNGRRASSGVAVVSQIANDQIAIQRRLGARLEFMREAAALALKLFVGLVHQPTQWEKMIREVLVRLVS